MSIFSSDSARHFWFDTTHNHFHSSALFLIPRASPPLGLFFYIAPLWHTQNLWYFHPNKVFLPLSFPSTSTRPPSSPLLASPPISFGFTAVYLAFVETASVLEDSPGINLPSLCQATDQQFTGHQLLGLPGGCLTAILGVGHDSIYSTYRPHFKHK